MENIFVPLDIAKKARRNKFNKQCIAIYDKVELRRINQQNTICNAAYTDYDNTIAAPTYQQVIDWLREKHGYYFCQSYNEGNWEIWMEEMNDENVENEIFVSDEYIEAYNKAIKFAFIKLNKLRAEAAKKPIFRQITTVDGRIIDVLDAEGNKESLKLKYSLTPILDKPQFIKTLFEVYIRIDGKKVTSDQVIELEAQDYVSVSDAIRDMLDDGNNEDKSS